MSLKTGSAAHPLAREADLQPDTTLPVTSSVQADTIGDQIVPAWYICAPRTQKAIVIW